MTISGLKTDWDMIVIGGGITGAGIFNEAVQRGLSCSASGAEGFFLGNIFPLFKNGPWRSTVLNFGKLVFGPGFGKGTARLLSEAPGLVDPLKFILADL